MSSLTGSVLATLLSVSEQLLDPTFDLDPQKSSRLFLGVVVNSCFSATLSGDASKDDTDDDDP